MLRVGCVSFSRHKKRVMTASRLDAVSEQLGANHTRVYERRTEGKEKVI